ncbi:MAG: hypothetical protein QG614_647 [Patescibacteria group bacterium]|nr:hypothetical protein [Patescibacteria group bacterium]
MFTSAWPYILRFALAAYYLFNHALPLVAGFKKIGSNQAIFECTGSLISPVLAFNLWHGMFVFLAIMILIWPRPVYFLAISLFVLLLEAYIVFGQVASATENSTNLLISICILINIVLLILYGRLKY